jgi:hypothetical protein
MAGKVLSVDSSRIEVNTGLSRHTYRFFIYQFKNNWLKIKKNM